MTQIALNGFEELDGTFLTVEAVAKLYGVDERTVQYWVDKDWCSRHRKGEYKLEDVVPGVYRAQLELINMKKGPDGVDIKNLQLREQTAKTEEAELKLAERKKELIPAAEVKLKLFEIARNTRDAVEAIAPRISAILAAETDPHKVRELLAAELRQALEELSK